MSEVDWNALSAPNAGAAFLQSFQSGMQQNRADSARNALSALVQDPNNPQALAALAKVDPATAMEFRTQQATLLKQQLAQHQDSILKGAEIIRQFQPKDQQTYSQALMAAQAAGIDISQVPQQYNPQYVDGIMKLADALKPQPDQVPGVEKDVQYFNSIGRPDLAQAVMLRHANPPQPIQTANPDGTITVNWVSPPLPGQPQQSAPIRPVGKLTPITGGPTPQASGGFPQ